MATKQGVKTSSGKGTGNKSSNRGRPPKSASGGTTKNQTVKKNSTYYKEEAKRKKIYHDEITLTVSLVVSLLLILSNFNLCGKVGHFVNYLTFGLIGVLAYIIPFLIFFGIAFVIANRGNKSVRIKIHSFIWLCITITGIIQLSSITYSSSLSIFDVFLMSAKEKRGGGLLGGILCKILVPGFGNVGTFVILIALALILVMFITGKAVLSTLSKHGESYLMERKERRIIEEEEYEAKVEAGLIERRQARTVHLKKQEDKKSNEVTAKSDRNPSDIKQSEIKDISSEDKVSKRKKKSKDSVNLGMTEIINENYNKAMEEVATPNYEAILSEKFGTETKFNPDTIDADINRLLKAANGDMDDDNSVESYTNIDDLKIELGDQRDQSTEDDSDYDENFRVDVDSFHELFEEGKEPEIITTSIGHASERAVLPITNQQEESGMNEWSDSAESESSHDDLGSSFAEVSERSQVDDSHREAKKEVVALESIDLKIAPISIEKVEYHFPPLDLLSKPKPNTKGVSEKDLKETAKKLQSTLESFGVRVTITNVSCGPAVTRYELQPEQGVKVSRITGLADDIKLNLAAADIRIEAPIPGKAAVGIEVPNKENTAVMFRELIDGQEFKKHTSSIAFAVGKDIGGQTIVTDIGKMPHLLIAGATGSGKSVCINTLIMSILYKANPEDVRMIMIDPKVVELSVYNGIPHLLIPVVTEPKKASAALNWAVVEMTERYNKFAELGVRDIKGYNEKIQTVEEYKDERYKKLPQIVIIVDELADLMMVAPGEVEDAICRLAQMARAAGLHLIIATQRPSVNVITGLIKANIPSRIAFSVSSAIDSRTIIDGSGAEKLLGKGDMLFFPSGYPKPVRVQGAFVSDKEVSSVVEFLKSQNSQPMYSEEVTNQISSAASVDSSNGSNGNDRDEYFIEAGKFIIEKDKASIGMLQRVYKIGFNRAARIMDQLSEAGVVGPEEGTKPRRVIMSLEEFETYVDEYV